MLFLLKRRWQDSLPALAVMLVLAISLRSIVPDKPKMEISWHSALAGAGLFGCLIFSDSLLHLLLLRVLGKEYRARYFELTHIFDQQSIVSLLAGAILAGLGEEPLFRGVTSNPGLLAALAMVFGLLHHAGRRLWVFTFWAVWQGFILAVALYITANLFVVMAAHFSHDLVGFLIFLIVNKKRAVSRHSFGGGNASFPIH